MNIHKKPIPWKPKPRLTTDAAFVKAAHRLWTEESIRQTEELAQQLLNQSQKAAA